RVGEQLDGQVELVDVDRVRALGQVVGQAGQHVDVLVGGLHLERTVDGRGLHLAEGAHPGQIVVVVVGQVAGQRALGGEGEDGAVGAEEDRLVVEIAAQRPVRAGAGDDLDRID